MSQPPPVPLPCPPACPASMLVPASVPTLVPRQVRRDKELLARKNELLNLEVTRLTEGHKTLSRQHQLAVGRLAELQARVRSEST